MVLNELKKLIEAELNTLGYDLVEFAFGNDTLTIVVDKESEIDMNMIVEVTNVQKNH